MPITSAPVPASAAEDGLKPAPAPAGSSRDPVNELLDRRSKYKDDPPVRPAPDGRPARKIGERIEGIIGQRGEWFHSDHAFDGFISPVTTPFLFEDPRALTEVRPIFIYQRVPGKQQDTGGGNITFFGTQGRVAITNRLSFVIHKLGGIWLNPNTERPFDDQSGFAELWFGPKYTFIRNEESGSLLAGGLQFQVPIGSKSAFQDTGTLSLVPYATYGQNLLRDCRAGSVNTLVNGGYSFSTTGARSDYLFLSGHIDLDVMNLHRIYPLAELNYVLTTTNGNTYPIGAEGRDLINFGGQAKGHGLLTGAIGARGKITECIQLGAAFEIPLAGPRDFFQYRFTLDLIWRY
jgi:hypothetical protein